MSNPLSQLITKMKIKMALKLGGTEAKMRKAVWRVSPVGGPRSDS